MYKISLMKNSYNLILISLQLTFGLLKLKRLLVKTQKLIQSITKLTVSLFQFTPSLKKRSLASCIYYSEHAQLLV